MFSEQKRMVSRYHYDCVERIGRSRRHGGGGMGKVFRMLRNAYFYGLLLESGCSLLIVL